VFLVVAAVVATGFFALMPALRATRIDPVRTLRGELVKEARPGRARTALIATQVFASTLLLICAAIFLRSSIASSEFDPGFRTTDVLMIELINQPKRPAMLQQLATDPTITAFAATRPNMLDQVNGYAETAGGKTPVGYKFVSGGYFDVMGIPILRGRTFTAAERDEHQVVVLAESLARTLFPNGDPLGQTFRLETTVNSDDPRKDDPPPARLVTVVGISRDIKGFRFTDIKPPGVFLPTSVDTPKTDVVARVSGEPELARQTLLEHLTRIDPNMGMIVMMRTVARLERFLLNVAFWIALVLGSLALLLTVSGLFSVLSYLVEQSSREIGIRMALGARARSVTQLMLAQTARPVGYGLIGGAALAAALAMSLLSTEFGAYISVIVHVTDPVAYLTSVMVIVIACVAAAWLPATRASRLDPMKTLRQD
jgi:hypothetical protein